MPQAIDPKVELLIEEKMKETRHKVWWDAQRIIIEQDNKIEKLQDKMADYDKGVVLQNQITQTMQKDINKLTDSIEKMSNKIDEKFDSLDKKYASKQEHQENQEKISMLIKIMWTFAIFTISWGAAFIFNLITRNI